MKKWPEWAQALLVFPFLAFALVVLVAGFSLRWMNRRLDWLDFGLNCPHCKRWIDR